MEFPLLSTGWFTVILDISWWFWHVSSMLQADVFRALSAALMGLSSSVLLSFAQSPYLQDSFFSVLDICWGPHAHFWEGHIQTFLHLRISALKMPQSVAALQASPCTPSVQVWTFLTVTGSAWSLLVWTGLGWIARNAGMPSVILI